MKKNFYFILLTICMLSLAGCNKQEVVNEEPGVSSEVVSAEPAISEDEQDSEGLSDNIENTEEQDSSMTDITEEEIRALVDANYFCITNVFKYGRLALDVEGETGRAVVPAEHFASFEEFETFIRSIYIKEEADYLLYEYCDGFPLYYEKDGVFYMRETLFGGGMVCPWESYEIENIEVEGDECRFSVYATYPADIAPEGVPGERYEYLAVKEDGWKLAFIVSRRDCSLEEAQKYLTETRADVGVDIDDENLITAKEAMEVAYEFYYGEDVGVSVYCDAMPYFDPENNGMLASGGIKTDENSGMGYVVSQFGANNTEEVFDASNPSPEKPKTCLTYVGKSENDAFYAFWLYSYIPDGDGEYHYSALDYILVTADGREIVSERFDMQGNYLDDVTAWKDYREFLNCTVVNSWFF